MRGQHWKTGNSEEMQNRVDTSTKVAANRKSRRHGRETFLLLLKTYWEVGGTPAQFIDPRYVNEKTWYSLFIYPV